MTDEAIGIRRGYTCGACQPSPGEVGGLQKLTVFSGVSMK